MKTCVLFVVAFALGLTSAQISSERQVRLEDIERDNLKSPQQTPQQRPTLQYQTAQYQQSPQYQQGPQYQQSPLLQYTPQYYQMQASAPSGPGAVNPQLFAQPSLNSGQLSTYHQQLAYSQPQQPILIPQHQSLPFPVMLIPSSYLLPQDINSIFYGQGLSQGIPHQTKYASAPAQQIQPNQVKIFRPSPQINPPQYSAQPQYNAYQTVYQQKFSPGVKSTVSPPLKDNYVGQSSNLYPSTYKLN